MRWIVIGAVLLAVVGGGLGAWLAADSGDDGFTRLVVGSFEIESAGAAGSPRLAQADALRLARAELGRRLPETVAENATVGGRSIETADLALRDSAFAPRATSVTSPDGRFTYRESDPRDLWVFAFRTTDVRMADWGIANGVVEAYVVVEDASGRVAANVGRYNPAVLGR